MTTVITKPLIACATNEDDFSGHVEAAAKEIGTDFWTSQNLDSAIEHCTNRLSCVVIDYGQPLGLNLQSIKRNRTSGSLLFVIPEGDVRAAFRAASAGAVNVIEKTRLSSELVVNLKTALASESRLENFRSGEKRFTDPLFEVLTPREKAILRLLMEGEPNKRVASLLDVGLRTVEAERAQVIKKMKVSSFVELIRLVSCIENDVIETRKSIFGSILPIDS